MLAQTVDSQTRFLPEDPIVTLQTKLLFLGLDDLALEDDDELSLVLALLQDHGASLEGLRPEPLSALFQDLGRHVGELRDRLQELQQSVDVILLSN